MDEVHPTDRHALPEITPRQTRLQIIISRKFRRRWPDLEFILLLHLAQTPSHFSELVEMSGASTSGVWNALQKMKDTDSLIFSEHSRGRKLYKLTEKGKSELTHLLN